MKRLLIFAICVMAIFVGTVVTSCNECDEDMVVRGDYTYDVVIKTSCEMPIAESELMIQVLSDNQVDLSTMSVKTSDLSIVRKNISNSLRGQITTPTIIGFTLQDRIQPNRFAAKITLPIND